jgi:hypothetical protein
MARAEEDSRDDGTAGRREEDMAGGDDVDAEMSEAEDIEDGPMMEHGAEPESVGENVEEPALEDTVPGDERSDDAVESEAAENDVRENEGEGDDHEQKHLSHNHG